MPAAFPCKHFRSGHSSWARGLTGLPGSGRGRRRLGLPLRKQQARPGSGVGVLFISSSPYRAESLISSVGLCCGCIGKGRVPHWGPFSSHHVPGWGLCPPGTGDKKLPQGGDGGAYWLCIQRSGVSQADWFPLNLRKSVQIFNFLMVRKKSVEHPKHQGTHTWVTDSAHTRHTAPQPESCLPRGCLQDPPLGAGKWLLLFLNLPNDPACSGDLFSFLLPIFNPSFFFFTQGKLHRTQII